MPQEELQVFSHQRSGTHLLLESLSRYFYPKKDLFLIVGNGKDRIYSDGEKRKKGKNIKVRGGKLLSSHKLPELCEWSKNNAIYIHRNGFDVLFSFYRLRTYGIKGKPRFDQWLTTERIEHWARHVSEWTATGVYVVRFEDLVTDYSGEMSKIANHFRFRHPPGGYVKPGLVGWNPGKGAIGKGKKHWSMEKRAILAELKEKYGLE